MRYIALLACVLLLSGEAVAADGKRITATGCVRTLSTCTMILTSSGGGFLLTGANLPQPGSTVRVRGRSSSEANSSLCPTRLTVKGTIAVESVRPVRPRGTCPFS
jgi:hypothetical protein